MPSNWTQANERLYNASHTMPGGILPILISQQHRSPPRYVNNNATALLAIVGVQKGGTTALRGALNMMPGVLSVRIEWCPPIPAPSIPALPPAPGRKWPGERTTAPMACVAPGYAMPDQIMLPTVHALPWSQAHHLQPLTAPSNRVTTDLRISHAAGAPRADAPGARGARTQRV